MSAIAYFTGLRIIKSCVSAVVDYPPVLWSSSPTPCLNTSLLFIVCVCVHFPTTAMIVKDVACDDGRPRASTYFGSALASLACQCMCKCPFSSSALPLFKYFSGVSETRLTKNMFIRHRHPLGTASRNENHRMLRLRLTPVSHTYTHTHTHTHLPLRYSCAVHTAAMAIPSLHPAGVASICGR